MSKTTLGLEAISFIAKQYEETIKDRIDLIEHVLHDIKDSDDE